MGGVPTCSPCHFGVFKLAVLGNCYNTYIAKILVSLWKCDFETLDRINRKSPYGKAVSLRISGEYAANNWRTALFAVIVRNIFTSYREYPANKTGQSKK